MVSGTTTFGQLPPKTPELTDIFAIQHTDGKNYHYTAQELGVLIGGGGGGNISSINGDTSAAQVFLAGTGLSIVNAGAQHTYSIGNHTHQDAANGGVLIATLALTATGVKDATTFLRGDDTWAVPIGGGGGAINSINGDTSPAQVLIGGTGIDILDVAANHTFSIDATVATLSDSQILLNKTLDGATNTLTGIFAITGLGVQVQTLNMGNQLISAVLNPVSGTDAANKQYVDNLVNGLAWKDSARAATTANITLSGAQTIDGVSVIAGDRVLVKDQTSGQFNGLYDAAAGAWTRTTDADSEADLLNMSVFIQEGSMNAGTGWTMTTPSPIVVDTTVLNYAQIGAGAGNPLTTKGDIFGYDTTGNRIPVGTNGQVLTANSAVALGVSWAAAGGGVQTPWAQNIDGAGFNLTDVGLLQADTLEIINAGAGANPTITSNSINQQFLLTGNLTIIGKATFNPDATNAGINVGGQVNPDPTNPINGDIVYNFTTNKFRAYENAVWVDMIGGGGVSALSGLTIDVTKNWATFGMTNFGVLSFDAPATSDPGQSDSISMQTGAFNPDMVFHVNANNSAYQFFIGSAGTAQYTFKNNTLDMAGAGITNPGNFLDANNNELLRWVTVASAVNYLEIENATTGNAPIFRVGAFGDANVGLEFQSRGTGNILFQNQSQELFELIHPSGSLANYMTITPSITANGPILGVAGTDADIDLNIDTKGTGAVDFNNNIVQNAILTSGIVVNAAVTWAEFRQTFNPNATIAGLNVGAHTAEPSTPVAGDIFYDSTAGQFKGYDGTWINLGAGATGGDVVGPASSTDNAVAIFDGATGKLLKNSTLNYNTNSQLTIPGPIIFSAAGTVPAGTNTYIREDGSDMDINVTSAGSVFIQYGATQGYQFSSTALDVNGRDILDADYSGRAVDIDVLVASGLGAGITYGNGIKQTFNPSTSNAGLNVGAEASDPSTPVNGDIYYNSAANELRARINGVWTELGAGGGTGDVTGPGSSVNHAIAVFDGATGKAIDVSGSSGFEVIIDLAGQPTWPRAILFNSTPTVQPSANSEWIQGYFGDLQINVGTGEALNISVSGAVKYQFTTTFMNFQRNDADQLGAVIFNTAGALTGGLATDPYIQWETGLTPDALRINVPSGTEHILSYNDVEEYTFSASIFTGNGNILRNWSSLELQSLTGPQLVIENTDSTPSAAQTVGFLRFRADRTASSSTDYGEIQTVIVDPSAASADGEMILKVIQANSLTEYISLNENASTSIHFKRPIQDFAMDSTTGSAQINSLEGLLFADDATQLTSNSYIQRSNLHLVINSPTGEDIELGINDLPELTIALNQLTINPGTDLLAGGDVVVSDRFQTIKGPDVGGATTITLGDGNYFDITSSATINHMTTTNWQSGSVVTLQFDAAGTVAHNTGSPPANTAAFFLTGAINFTAAAGDTLTVTYDGGLWREVSRASQKTPGSIMVDDIDLNSNNLIGVQVVVHNQSAITYAATLAFDFDVNQEQTLAVTGDLTTLTTSNRGAGKSKSIFITGDTVNRTLTFNASWRTNPATATVTINANTFGLLTFGCKGGAETDVFCAYAEFV